jgi:hypothetical protein
MIESLLTVVFLIFWIGIMSSFYFAHKAQSRMRDFHADIFEGLGRPSLLSSGIVPNIRFIRFFSSNKIEAINDPELNKLRTAWLSARWVSVILLLGLVGAVWVSL